MINNHNLTLRVSDGINIVAIVTNTCVSFGNIPWSIESCVACLIVMYAISLKLLGLSTSSEVISFI